METMLILCTVHYVVRTYLKWWPAQAADDRPESPAVTPQPQFKIDDDRHLSTFEVTSIRVIRQQ